MESTNRVKTMPIPRGCAHVKWAAKQWFAKAVQARKSFQQWKEAQTYIREQRTWKAAALYVQRFYPRTYAWLMSCSSTEGGHGKWVPNRDGAPPGGWMQMYESTFNRFMHHGWYAGGRTYRSTVEDLRARGYKIRDESIYSWYSPVGQALSSAYAVIHGRIGEWDSTGCYERHP